jgi:hypothetical protein
MLSSFSPFLFFLVFVLCIYQLPFFNLKGISKVGIVLLFTVKAIAALVVTHFAIKLFSGSDSQFYFAHGQLLQQLAYSHPMQFVNLLFGIYNSSNAYAYYTIINVTFLPFYNDGELMIKVNALLHFVSWHNIYSHTLFFTFLSFCGLTGFYKTIELITASSSKWLYSTLIFFPSLLIYSSPILKESVLVAASGIFVFALAHAKIKQKGYHLCIASGLFLLLIKPYFILLFAPVLITHLIFNKVIKHPILSFVVMCISLSIYFLGLSAMSNYLNSEDIPYKIALAQQSSLKSSVYLNAESYSAPPIIAASWKSLIKNIPLAFYHSISTPVLSFSKKIFVQLAAVENLLVLGLFLLNLAGCFIRKNKFWSYHFCIVVFVFIFYVLTGFTQSLEGIMLRLKAPVLPFLISGLYLLLLNYRNGKRSYEFIFD